MKRCICGAILAKSDKFCPECGRLFLDINDGRRDPRLLLGTLVSVGGILLIALALTTGLQEMSGSWRFRAVGVAFIASDTPSAVQRFSQLLPFAGFVLAALGIGMFMAQNLTLRAFRLSVAWVSLAVLIFQGIAYFIASSWFARENEKARILCDYCTPPHPRLLEWPPAVATAILVVILLASLVRIVMSRQQRRV